MSKAALLTTARQLMGRALPLLLLGLAACAESDELNEALPSPQAELTATFTDTVTVRASTVLTDSVPSAATDYLLLGRYHDGRLGTITGRGYLQLGLTSAFTPDPALRYDSLVLVLTADAYRYGDTTRTQTVEVHRQQQAFQAGKTYFANDALPYESAAVGRRTFRARAGLVTLRVPLSADLGQELWNAGQNGQLTTVGEVQARLKGLVLTPGDADNAALIRWSATTDASVLYMYYHDPAAPTEALAFPIPAAGDYMHFFQLSADHAGTALAGLTSSRAGLSSAATQEELFIEAGLGIKTKLEFPYLAQLKELGGTIVINSAQLNIETVSSAAHRFLPPPALLYPRLTDRANHNGAFFLGTDGTVVGMAYEQALSARTGLDQGRYSLGMTSYVQSVLRGTLPNQGILLGSETPGSAERVVLGSAKNPGHPLRLRIYYTRITI